MNTFYTRLDNMTFAPHASTSGPWAADYQHGGPPFALAYKVAAEIAPDTLIPVSGRFDFFRPIRVTETTCRTSVVTRTRSTALIDVNLVQDGDVCAQTRFWFTQPVASDLSLEKVDSDYQTLFADLMRNPIAAQPVHLGYDNSGNPYDWLHADSGYMKSGQWRIPEQGFRDGGPGVAAWHCSHELVAGERTSASERAFLLADAAWSFSRSFSLADMIAVNTDIIVHLSRPPVGDWLGFSAENTIARSAGIYTSAVLVDQNGLVGQVAQSLAPGPARKTQVRTDSTARTA